MPLQGAGVIKINSQKRLEMINDIRENILKEGIITDFELAEEIARRWIGYS